jgi:hypothetical protein
MTLRRQFLFAGLTATVLRGTSLGPKERIDRAIRGGDLDRPPFTFWHHFGLNSPEDHAKATLKFHQKYRTDLVKVMSDFPIPALRASGTNSNPNPILSVPRFTRLNWYAMASTAANTLLRPSSILGTWLRNCRRRRKCRNYAKSIQSYCSLRSISLRSRKSIM